jgi:hypothetical protein
MKSRKNKKVWDRSADSYQRKIGNRELIDTFLIVCEGQKTEPLYFKAFDVKKDVIELEISGEGRNTLSLITQAIEKRDKGIKTNKRYNQVWCVFDKDSFSDKNFNAAIYKARDNNIRTAYTNEAFELWYLLHFMYYDSALSRNQYRDILTQHLKQKYEKNDPSLYERLKPYQDKAIKNARKLRSQYPSHNPAKDNPCTTVYELVEELNNFCE